MALSRSGFCVTSLLIAAAVQVASAAAPRIAKLNVNTARVGATITISGENFSQAPADNTVWFGAVRATVSAATPTSLEVAVPVGATHAPVSVTVNGLTATSPQPFVPTFVGEAATISSSTFAPAFNVPVGDGPCTVVLADIDNDGAPDVVVGDGYGRNLRIMRNVAVKNSLSAASFGPGVVFPSPGGTSANPYKLTTADLDGDGKLDLVGCGVVMDQISLWHNTATAGVISGASLSGPLLLPAAPDTRFARAADLDGDGRLDIISASYGNSTISVYKNIGTPGSLSPDSFAPRVDFPCGPNPYELDIADLDGDGALDIAVVNVGSSISLFRNIAAPGVLDTNSFAARIDLPAPTDGSSLCIGDVDADGKPDILAGFVRTHAVAVYRNTSVSGSLTSDSFAAPVEFGAGHWVHNVAFADLNGDSLPDLLSDGEINSYMSVFQNLSTPGEFTTNSLAPRVDFPAGWNAWGLAVADLDADGRPDVVFGNAYDDTLSVYKNIAPSAGPPTILTHPADRTVGLGEDATFLIQAAGSSDLAYQWWKDTAPLAHATNNTVTVTAAGITDAGQYFAVVTNSYGAVTSAVAVLTVSNVAPYLISGPQPQTVPLNGNVEFSVTAGGNRPLAYQWLLNGTNLPGATAPSLALTNVQLAHAGTYAVEVSNALGSVRSPDALLTVIVPPSRVLTLETNAPSGWPVTIPVLIVANGNENAVSFSIKFAYQTRSPLLRFVDAAIGSGAQGASLLVNTNQLASGRVGIALALPADAVFPPGTQEIARVTFDSAVTTFPQAGYEYLEFADAPMPRQVTDALARTVPSIFTGSRINLLPSDIEGDSSPRPYGDRTLTLNDWVQAGRFAAGLDIASPGEEFQRADSAPRETRGDGYIKVTDWVQSGRYFAKLDPLLAAGGASSPASGIGGALPPAGAAFGPGKRHVHILEASGAQGLPVEVPVELESEGNENALGFTVSFDPTLLRYHAAVLGKDATGALLNVNTRQPGKLGLALALPTGSAFASGSRQVARLTFVPLSNASEPLSLSFADAPVLRAVSDPAASELQANFIPGQINVTPPPSLQISLSGGQTVLTWPISAQGFQLQASPDALSGLWTNLSASAVTNGDLLKLSLPTAGTATFFRLHRP